MCDSDCNTQTEARTHKLRCVRAAINQDVTGEGKWVSDIEGKNPPKVWLCGQDCKTKEKKFFTYREKLQHFVEEHPKQLYRCSLSSIKPFDETAKGKKLSSLLDAKKQGKVLPIEEKEDDKKKESDDDEISLSGRKSPKGGSDGESSDFNDPVIDPDNFAEMMGMGGVK